MGNKENMLVFGAGVDLTEAGDTDTLLHTVDAQWEMGKLGLYGAYLGRTIEDAKVGTGADGDQRRTATTGASSSRPRTWSTSTSEPFLRYDFINFDADLLPAGTKENQVHEITAGVNYYFKGHNAKFTADFTYLPNGTPVADTRRRHPRQRRRARVPGPAQFQLLL